MTTAYKHKIYTTLGTAEKVESDAVAVVTNSSGVPARNYSILGKTIVWNQMLDKSKYPATTIVNGVTFTNNGDGTITANGTVSSSDNVYYNLLNTIEVPVGHKILISGGVTGAGWSSYLLYDSSDAVYGIDSPGGGKIYTIKTSPVKLFIFIVKGYTVSNLVFKPQLFDLTKMFGAGNEPSTPEEFRAMFPDDYYPYNAGELKSIMPASIEASSPIRFNLLDTSGFTEKVNTIMNGITAKLDQDKSIYVTGTATGNGGRNSWGLPVNLTATHKYYVTQIIDDMTGPYLSMIGQPSKYFSGQFITCDLSGQYTFGYNVKAGVTYDRHIYPMVVDLTEMYGAGNEPTIASAIPSFWGFDPNAYKRVNIPSSKYFPDGMRSAGSARDEIQNDGAIKRIGSVDLGTLTWTYGGAGDNRYFATSGISDIKKISGGSDIPGLLNVIYPAFAQSNWYLNKPCMFKIVGNTPSFCISDPAYTDAAAFKAAMSGVMLYYELDTTVRTAISPALQSLPTYRGFNSFSVPNSLTQNGPLSVTYYAEGGANPERGWLTSYKRKLYMGRNIEWNQLFTNSVTSSNGVTISQNQDGTMALNGTVNKSYINFTNLSDAMNQAHKYLLCLKILNNPDSISFAYGWLNRNGMRTSIISNGESCTICNQTEPLTQLKRGSGLSGFTAGTVFNSVKIAVMVMDLTQMFGAGNEPATPAEFWSYFDHKLYPYNAGETQPLFKISRKSQWGGGS